MPRGQRSGNNGGERSRQGRICQNQAPDGGAAGPPRPQLPECVPATPLTPGHWALPGRCLSMCPAATWAWQRAAALTPGPEGRGRRPSGVGLAPPAGGLQRAGVLGGGESAPLSEGHHRSHRGASASLGGLTRRGPRRASGHLGFLPSLTGPRPRRPVAEGGPWPRGHREATQGGREPGRLQTCPSCSHAARTPSRKGRARPGGSLPRDLGSARAAGQAPDQPGTVTSFSLTFWF